MKYYEILNILNKCNKVLDSINNLDNSTLKSKITHLLDNCQSIIENMKKFENLFDDKVRYCDYYNDFINYNENMKFFETNYLEPDKDIRKILYALYCFSRNFDVLTDLILENSRLDIDLMEIVNIINIDDLINYSNYVAEYLGKVNTTNNSEFSFLDEESMYKILFTGKSFDDISKLSNNTIMQVIRKIEKPLATEKIVPKSEGIDHVRDAYNFPVFRIQVADDYRIAYLRYNDITAIIGITLKNGKNSDYTRYDSVAKNQQQIYQEIEQFSKGILDYQHIHYKTIEILKQVIEKNKFKKSLK